MIQCTYLLITLYMNTLSMNLCLTILHTCRCITARQSKRSGLGLGSQEVVRPVRGYYVQIIQYTCPCLKTDHSNTILKVILNWLQSCMCVWENCFSIKICLFKQYSISPMMPLDAAVTRNNFTSNIMSNTLYTNQYIVTDLLNGVIYMFRKQFFVCRMNDGDRQFPV